jgi:hypothetical protein|tara:strand:+ start:310 stop:714 length:405 start_codon:yes stop_codon:yes gene_type:complete
MGLLTKGIGAAIKGFKPAKDLTSRRKGFDDMISTVNKQFKSADLKPGSSASKLKKKFWKKSSDIHDKYEKDVKASKKAKSTQTKKAVGAAVGTGAAVVGAHVGAKRKWPKYKKFAESDIKTVDGKLKLVPKKKD